MIPKGLLETKKQDHQTDDHLKNKQSEWMEELSMEQNVLWMKTSFGLKGHLLKRWILRQDLEKKDAKTSRR